MSEAVKDYYRVYYQNTGIYSPLLKRSHLINEINTSLLHTGMDQLSITIIPIKMSESEYKNRPNELKYYGNGEKEN